MFSLSIGAGETRMQEAVIAGQILRRQARSMTNTAISSDAIISEDRTSIFEYSTENLGFLPDLSIDLISATSDFGAHFWFVSSEAFFSLSSEALDDSQRSGGSSSGVTSDQAEKQAMSEQEKEQGEIYARMEDVKDELPENTYNRLRQRFEDLFELEDEEPIRVSPGSARQLLQFLRKDRRLRCPGIFITDRRNIKAIWQASESQIFWIEFEPNGDVTYLAFFPNKKRSDGVERISALSTIEDALDRARETGALAWMRS